MRKKRSSSPKLRIVNVVEKKFSNSLTDEIIEGFNEDKLAYRIAFSLDVDSIEDNEVGIKVRIKVAYSMKEEDEKESSNEFLTIETESEFLLRNYSDKDLRFFENEQSTYFDDSLAVLLLDTALGATRGMISYKTASIPLNFTLPLFNSKIFIENYNNVKLLNEESTKRDK